MKSGGKSYWRCTLDVLPDADIQQQTRIILSVAATTTHVIALKMGSAYVDHVTDMHTITPLALGSGWN